MVDEAVRCWFMKQLELADEAVRIWLMKQLELADEAVRIVENSTERPSNEV